MMMSYPRRMAVAVAITAMLAVGLLERASAFVVPAAAAGAAAARGALAVLVAARATLPSSPPPPQHATTVLSAAAGSSAGGGGEEKPESDVERLLRRARELRSQADRDEQQVHSDLADKKARQDGHLDGLIGHLLLQQGVPLVAASAKKGATTAVAPPLTKAEVVDRLHSKKVSMDTLEKIVDRLDELAVMASGREHVRATSVDSNSSSAVKGEDNNKGRVGFERVSHIKDVVEAQRLEAMVEILLEAVQVLDDEFKQAKLEGGTAKAKKGGGGGQTGSSTSSSTSGSLLYSVSAAESEHWGGGQCAQRLRQRLQEMRREREDQYLKRQEEIFEAQRIKKTNGPPPPKARDDHGFL